MIRILKRHLHLAKNLKIDSKYFQILSIISTDMDFNFIHVTILCTLYAPNLGDAREPLAVQYLGDPARKEVRKVKIVRLTVPLV